MTSGNEEVRRSAEEMENIRQKQVAYEYLCHLEEAKKWLEAEFHEDLPPCTELEEFLRNSVTLAKLGNKVVPDVVSKNHIYDLDKKRYKAAGLQFRHTDNINFWIKSLKAIKLPVTLHPETTDVYDKKNMPRVIYCIHALSSHLFKLRKAPQDLYGKVTFTEEEISVMTTELQRCGVQLPAFQKIGGLLAKDLPGDLAALHAAVIAISRAIDSEDREALSVSLENRNARLEFVLPEYLEFYASALKNAKDTKVEAALKRSLNDSYVADVYDELLTQAEIQGHITSVNGSSAVQRVNNELASGSVTALLAALRNPCLDIDPELLTSYAALLYWEEMVADRCDYGHDLTLQDIKTSVSVLSRIAALSSAVDSGSHGSIWTALMDLSTILRFEGLEPSLQTQYCNGLIACRSYKLLENVDCTIFNCADIQDCISLVNARYEENNQVINCLQQLNIAMEMSQTALVQCLQNPALNIGDNVNNDVDHVSSRHRHIYQVLLFMKVMKKRK